MPYLLRILKYDSENGQRSNLVFTLPNIEKVLSVSEIFAMEMKLNQLPNLRFHIEETE